jgi:hypothetical protein
LVVNSSFFGILALFLTDELRLLTMHEVMQFHFTDELSKSIFQQADSLSDIFGSASAPFERDGAPSEFLCDQLLRCA